jgi:hypothetical protein
VVRRPGQASRLEQKEGETMTIHIPSKSNELASDQKLIAGIQKHLTTASVVLAGTTYTGAALVEQVQARLSAVNSTLAARATWQAAVKAEEDTLASSQGFLAGLRKALYTMFSNVDDLADFGLVPHKKAVLTPAERVAATAKAKATRAARHTMGKVQKKAITGASASPVGGSSSATPVAPTVVAPATTGAAPSVSGSGTPHA